MTDDSDVSVRAVRPFEGAEGYKDETSEPFTVSARRFNDLKANGLVERADGEPDEKQAAEPDNKKAPEPANKAGSPAGGRKAN